MMFVVFNSAGDPVRFGACPDHALEQQAKDGETVIPWDRANDPVTDWRLVHGVLTKK